MKTKKFKRVFKTTEVNDEIFAVICASAYVLTELQYESEKAANLAFNLWQLYLQLGGHKRLHTIRIFDKLLVEKFFSK